jgi:hypothetical protein
MQLPCSGCMLAVVATSYVTIFLQNLTALVVVLGDYCKNALPLYHVATLFHIILHYRFSSPNWGWLNKLSLGSFIPNATPTPIFFKSNSMCLGNRALCSNLVESTRLGYNPDTFPKYALWERTPSHPDTVSSSTSAKKSAKSVSSSVANFTIFSTASSAP